ncbi:hypothetical protein HPP92_028783 [Vanilla planifolia]|uniref:Uncharacterized protein n=1 Tax=Vanilla planifolia TaxID=51239 RepID=A0A835U342_VANPL|nr:hypothetical protein HPP92_028783 [Vanilla planifolia]KAG0446572.1 hypothetical protein HPP92_028772 [Vanilla planifolia]
MPWTAQGATLSEEANGGRIAGMERLIGDLGGLDLNVPSLPFIQVHRIGDETVEKVREAQMGWIRSWPVDAKGFMLPNVMRGLHLYRGPGGAWPVARRHLCYRFRCLSSNEFVETPFFWTRDFKVGYLGYHVRLNNPTTNLIKAQKIESLQRNS